MRDRRPSCARDTYTSVANKQARRELKVGCNSPALPNALQALVRPIVLVRVAVCACVWQGVSRAALLTGCKSRDPKHAYPSSCGWLR